MALSRLGSLPARLRTWHAYFPAQANPSADGPASISLSTFQSDVRIAATL